MWCLSYYLNEIEIEQIDSLDKFLASISKYKENELFKELYVFGNDTKTTSYYYNPLLNNGEVINLIEEELELKAQYIDEAMLFSEQYTKNIENKYLNSKKAIIRNYYDFVNGIIYIKSSCIIGIEEVK